MRSTATSLRVLPCQTLEMAVFYLRGPVHSLAGKLVFRWSMGENERVFLPDGRFSPVEKGCMVRIVVCVKHVPDPADGYEFADGHVDRRGDGGLAEIDENALTAARQLGSEEAEVIP
jgi:hypothetical protein